MSLGRPPARWSYDSFSVGPPPNRTYEISRYPALQWTALRGLVNDDSIVSASRISRTSTSCHQVHLSPFAMCPAFPDPDYYEDSVALGLAPRRRS